MEKLLYPQRKRCRKCRSFFGFEVVDLLYCSYECAGRPRPPVYFPAQLSETDFGSNIRQCLNGPKGDYLPKRAYITEEEVLIALKKQQPRRGESFLQAYKCGICAYYHLGHNYSSDLDVEEDEFVNS